MTEPGSKINEQYALPPLVESFNASSISGARIKDPGETSVIMHPSSDLEVVMSDVLRSGTDEAHCFLNEGALRERMGLFRDHFIPEMEERRIIYAMKANPKERILKILMEEGLDGFDCASFNEIHSALQIPSTRPGDIYFNHPIKKQSAVMQAYALGIRYYTAQSRSGPYRDAHLVTPDPRTVRIARITLSTRSWAVRARRVSCVANISNMTEFASPL